MIPKESLQSGRRETEPEDALPEPFAKKKITRQELPTLSGAQPIFKPPAAAQPVTQRLLNAYGKAAVYHFRVTSTVNYDRQGIGVI